ncbi:hypothetical protein R1sor_019203 [Riccia sorocarpa]|uniref:Uncharacterized protein n=1 Tax=Riccia sorocarpa TaxID=122646 RepID=A0ABD3ICF8_9MARC
MVRNSTGDREKWEGTRRLSCVALSLELPSRTKKHCGVPLAEETEVSAAVNLIQEEQTKRADILIGTQGGSLEVLQRQDSPLHLQSQHKALGNATHNSPPLKIDEKGKNLSNNQNVWIRSPDQPAIAGMQNVRTSLPHSPRSQATPPPGVMQQSPPASVKGNISYARATSGPSQDQERQAPNAEPQNQQGTTDVRNLVPSALNNMPQPAACTDPNKVLLTVLEEEDANTIGSRIHDLQETAIDAPSGYLSAAEASLPDGYVP